MAKITNIEDARKAADEMATETSKVQEENKSIYQSLFEEVNKLDASAPDFDTLAAILSLSEEKFSVLSEIFLDELEKSYQSVNDKLMLAQAMNVAGLRSEDAQDQYIALCNDIDTKINSGMSAQKKDFLKRILGISFNAMAEASNVSKRIVNIPIEFCKEGAQMPTYAHLTDAGMDIYALEDITIAPGETKLVPTGIKVAIPKGYELQVRPKSGRCLKTKLRVANTPGTIDSGYRDEIGVIIENVDPPIRAIHFGKKLYEGDKLIGEDPDYIGPDSIEYGSSYTIGKGEKFAQLVLNEIPRAVFYTVDSVNEISNDGRNGGFGSSGLK